MFSNKDDAARLGASIKVLRIGKNLSQEALGELAGCSSTMISRIERGGDCMVGSLLRIARALGTTLDELLQMDWDICPRCGGSGVVHSMPSASEPDPLEEIYNQEPQSDTNGNTQKSWVLPPGSGRGTKVRIDPDALTGNKGFAGEPGVPF